MTRTNEAPRQAAAAVPSTALEGQAPARSWLARLRRNFGCRLLAWTLGTLPASVAEAVIHAGDSFSYTNGGLNGKGASGSGWGGSWSAPSQPQVTTPGLTYNDGLGSALTVAGGATLSGTGNTLKKAERTLTDTNLDQNGDILWLSVVIRGATGASRTNVNLSEKFFIGQGNKDTGSTSWILSDASSSAIDFTSTVSAEGETDFLVTLIEFASGSEKAWLWINPQLNSPTLDKNLAANGLAGTTIENFEFDKVFFYYDTNSNSNPGQIDELRLGDSYGAVAPFVSIPEVSAAACVGLAGVVGLCARLARRRGRCRVVG